MALTSSFYYSFLNKNNLDTGNNIALNYAHRIGNTDTPVFFIVFDELSSYLLLDDNKEINESLFPELKEFSKTSTWYPNALNSSAIPSKYGVKSNFLFGDNSAKSKSSENLCRPYKIRNAVPP